MPGGDRRQAGAGDGESGSEGRRQMPTSRPPPGHVKSRRRAQLLWPPAPRVACRPRRFRPRPHERRQRLAQQDTHVRDFGTAA